MVIGEGEKFPAVLIVPDMDELMSVVSSSFELLDISGMKKDPKVRKVYQEIIDQLNLELGNWAKIKEFRLLNQSWTPEKGERTPTMKLKRRVIKEKYKPYIDSIYEEGKGFDFDEFEDIDIENMSMEELEKYEQMEAL